MPRLQFRRRGTRVQALTATLAVLAVAATTAACGPEAADDPPRTDAAPSASPSGSGPPVDVLTESKNIVANAFKGTYRPPDATTRIAAKGKKIAIISRGQVSASSKVPTDAAEEAARALGWTVVRYDLNLDVRKAPEAVQNAIAAEVHGIVTNIDCAYAASQFAEAKARNIKIIPLFAFDCTDPTVTGQAGPPQFTTFVNYTNSSGERPDPGRQNALAGYLAASALIVATDATAKVIAFTETTSTILTYMHLGFVAQIKKCKTCQLLEEVRYTSADVTSGALMTKVQDALQRHPGVTGIRGPNSTSIQNAIAPALVAAKMQNRVFVVGGEGQDKDLDLIRTRQGLNITLSFDTPWHAWATIDALNSAFNGEPSRFPGIGGMLIDREHNLPPSGPVVHNINYKSVYRKAWGVG